MPDLMMPDLTTPDLDAQRWTIVLRRDRAADGQFVTGVLSTGIYCRPSCAARHPKRENVRFFAGGVEARDFGLRPACAACPIRLPPTKRASPARWP